MHYSYMSITCNDEAYGAMCKKVSKGWFLSVLSAIVCLHTPYS